MLEMSGQDVLEPIDFAIDLYYIFYAMIAKLYMYTLSVKRLITQMNSNAFLLIRYHSKIPIYGKVARYLWKYEDKMCILVREIPQYILNTREVGGKSGLILTRME